MLVTSDYVSISFSIDDKFRAEVKVLVPDVGFRLSDLMASAHERKDWRQLVGLQ